MRRPVTALVVLFAALLAVQAGAMTPDPSDEASRARLEKDLQESCHNTMKLVMDWAAFDAQAAPPSCDESHVSVWRMCHNFVEVVASMCRDAKPSSKAGARVLAAFPPLTELRCALDTKHEALARAYLAAHPYTGESKCPRDAALDDAMRLEVFKDQGTITKGSQKGKLISRPHGTLSVEGTVMTYTYTFDTDGASYDFVEGELTRLAEGNASAGEALESERPQAGFDRTRAKLLKDVVLLDIKERYPDLPPGKRRYQKHYRMTGPPKLLVFTLGGAEVGQVTLDELGNVKDVTGKIPDGPTRKHSSTGSSTNPTVEIELTFKDNLPVEYSSNSQKGKYVDGKRDGTWTLAVDLTEQVWAQGVLQSAKTHWIKDGKATGTLSTEQVFKNGKPGKTTYYDHQGEVISAKAWEVLDDPLLARPHGKVVNKRGDPNGSECRENGNCMSGLCKFKSRSARIGVCRPEPGDRPDLGGNAECHTDSECLSGFCTSGICE